ncbi:MAG: hypothetical protein JOZ39_03510 [Chloroflexi bacterium]|nr:hypothetical protein [Chloroflexota bacterium]
MGLGGGGALAAPEATPDGAPEADAGALPDAAAEADPDGAPELEAAALPDVDAAGLLAAAEPAPDDVADAEPVTEALAAAELAGGGELAAGAALPPQAFSSKRPPKTAACGNLRMEIMWKPLPLRWWV